MAQYQALHSFSSMNRQGFRLKPLFIGLIFTFTALFAGLLCVFMPWWIVLGLVGSLLYPAVLIKFPTAGIFFYMALLLLSPDWKASDALTMATLVIYGVVALGDKRRVPMPQFELRLLLALLSLAGVSAVFGYFFFGNTLPYIYRDSRSFIYWLWMPVVYWRIAGNAQNQIKINRVLVMVALLVSVIAIVQYVFGLQIVREGRVGALENVGTVDVDTTRVQMPGFTFVLVSVCWAFAAMARGGRRLFVLIPLTLLLIAGLYVNFGRALWAWSMLSILLTAVVIGGARGLKLLVSIGVAAGLALGGLMLFKPTAVDGAVKRLESVLDEGGNKTSFGWRRLENAAAFKSIGNNPAIGVALGGEYRAWVPEIRNFSEHTRYIHNAYIFIATKLGIPGLLVVLTLLASILRRMYLARRHIAQSGDYLLPAAMAALLPLLGMSVTQPELLAPHSVVLLSILSAKVLSIRVAAARPSRIAPV